MAVTKKYLKEERRGKGPKKVEAVVLPPKPEDLAEIIKLARSNPSGLATALFGKHYYGKQQEIWDAVFEGEKDWTAVKSGNGTGKSYIIPDIALLFLLRYINSQVLIVGPTRDSLRSVSFKHLTSTLEYDKKNFGLFQSLGGKETYLRYALSNSWYIQGKVARSREALQGDRAPHLLVIIDEASGVENWVFEAIRTWQFHAGADGSFVKTVLFGNPTRNSGEFYDAFHALKDDYNLITISAFDTPNFTGEDFPEDAKRGLPTPNAVERELKRCERRNSMDEYQIKVLGEFPTQSEASIYNAELLNRARRRTLDNTDDRVLWSRPRFALDVARHGNDNCVLACSEGPRVRLVDAWGKTDLMQTTYRAISAITEVFEQLKEEKAKYGNQLEEWDCDIIVDANGMGYGVVDRMREVLDEQGLGFQLHTFDAAKAPVIVKNRKNFPNRRTEMWFWLKELMDEEDLDLPDSEELMGDLLGTEYKYNQRNQRAVEDKQKTKERIGRSPDEADAVLMSLCPLYEHAAYVSH